MDELDLSAENERSQRAEHTFWQLVGALYARRRFIVIVTGLVAVLSVVITLFMPNWYRASTRLLMPEGSGLSGSLLANLPSAATALLGGGGGGDFQRYQSILTSRTMLEAVVDSFDLITVYETADSRAPLDNAIDDLLDNSGFDIDLEYRFLSVSVMDKDPQRAADMANYYVQRLNATNAGLAAQNASNYRQYIETRYLESRAAMDAVLDSTRRFQELYGVYDLPAQTQGFFTQIGQLRATAVAAEIQLEVARSQFGSDNSQVTQFRALADAANRKYRNALAGGERLLPVAQSDVPVVARTYAGLEMERVIQTAILEILGPMYEQARLQEEKETKAVQIIDNASPPVLKAKPKRMIIVILATLSALLIAMGYVLAQAWLRRHSAYLLTRLQQATRNS